MVDALAFPLDNGNLHYALTPLSLEPHGNLLVSEQGGWRQAQHLSGRFTPAAEDGFQSVTADMPQPFVLTAALPSVISRKSPPIPPQGRRSNSPVSCRPVSLHMSNSPLETHAVLAGWAWIRWRPRSREDEEPSLDPAGHRGCTGAGSIRAFPLGGRFSWCRRVSGLYLWPSGTASTRAARYQPVMFSTARIHALRPDVDAPRPVHVLEHGQESARLLIEGSGPTTVVLQLAGHL